jgi:hypothetical protein
VLSDSINDNYEIFIQEVVATGVAYTLKGSEGYVVVASEKFPDGEVIPFWSSEESAKAVCVDDWSDYEVEAISIEGFVEEWLEGMHEDELLVGPNWTEDLEGLEIEPLVVADEIDSLLDEIEVD